MSTDDEKYAAIMQMKLTSDLICKAGNELPGTYLRNTSVTFTCQFGTRFARTFMPKAWPVYF